MPLPVEKHLPYFLVLEALREASGCPLCHLETEVIRRYFESLLFESVNDPSVRAELLQARGYCHRHAHRLLQERDGLGTAILYQDQLTHWSQRLSTPRQTPRRAWNHRRRSRPVGAACPACQVQLQARERHVIVLLEGLADTEMHTALAASHGLCAPHCLATLDLVEEDRVREALLTIQAAKTRQLLAELAEYIRKQDYRYRDEGLGPEGDAWRRAVTMMVGEAGVF